MNLFLVNILDKYSKSEEGDSKTEKDSDEKGLMSIRRKALRILRTIADKILKKFKIVIKDDDSSLSEDEFAKSLHTTKSETSIGIKRKTTAFNEMFVGVHKDNSKKSFLPQHLP